MCTSTVGAQACGRAHRGRASRTQQGSYEAGRAGCDFSKAVRPSVQCFPDAHRHSRWVRLRARLRWQAPWLLEHTRTHTRAQRPQPTPRAVSPLRSFLECLVTRSWCLVSPLRPRESENRTFNLRGQPVRNEGATSMPPKLVNYIDKCISRLAARGARATALRLLSRRSQQWRRRPPYLCA